MGNTLKARLHLNKKKDDRPTRNNNQNTKNEIVNPPRTEIDEAIMSGPNRARAVGQTLSDTVPPPTTPRGIDASQPTTKSRGQI
jgi:hypothetical protein